MSAIQSFVSTRQLEEQLSTLTLSQNSTSNPIDYKKSEREKIKKKILENGFSYEEMRNYIYVLVDKSEIDTAIEEIKQFEKSRPDTVSFSFLEAVINLAQNKKKEAKKAIIKYLDLHPFDMEAWVWLASNIKSLEIQSQELTQIIVTTGTKFIHDQNSDFTYIQKATVPFLGKDAAKFMQFSDSEITTYLAKESLAHISHKQSRQFVQDVAGNSSSNAREHCQIDKASASEGEFPVTDCANCPRVCEKYGLDPWIVLSMLLGLTSQVSTNNKVMVELLQNKLIALASSKPLSLFFQKNFLAFTYFSCRKNNELLPFKFFHALYTKRPFCMTAHLCFAATWMTIDNPFGQPDETVTRDMRRACLKLLQMQDVSNTHRIIGSIIANRHEETNTKWHQTLCVAAACEFDDYRLWQTVALQLLIEARQNGLQLIFAEFAARKTLQCEPGDIKALLILAEAYQKSGNSSEARKHFEKIPVNKKTIHELETLSLVVSEYWLSQRQFQKSFQIDALYLHTKGKDNVEDEFWHSYAQSCIAVENYTQAKYALTHAVRKKHRNDNAWFLYIVTCALLGNFEEAKNYLYKCLRSDIVKSHSLFWAISSVIYWKTGDKQSTIESQKKMTTFCKDEMQDLLFPRIMKLYEAVLEEQKIDASIQAVQDLYENENFKEIAVEIKKIPFSHYNQKVIDIAFIYSWKEKNIDFACTLAKQFLKNKLTTAHFHWALGERRLRENKKQSALDLFTKASQELPLQEKIDSLKKELSPTTFSSYTPPPPKLENTIQKPLSKAPKRDKTEEVQKNIASRKAKKEQVKPPEKKQNEKKSSEKKPKAEDPQVSVKQVQQQIAELEIIPAKKPMSIVHTQSIYPKDCSSFSEKGLASSAKTYLQWLIDTSERDIDPEIKRSSLLYYGFRLFEHLRRLDGFKDLDCIRHAIRHNANQIALNDLIQFAKAIKESDLKKSLKTMIEKNQHPFALSVPTLSNSIELSDSELLKKQLCVCKKIYDEIGSKITWQTLFNDEGDKNAAIKASMLLIGKILSRHNCRANGLQKIIEAANKIAHDTGDLELLNYSIFDEVSPEEIKSFLTSYQQLENLTVNLEHK